MAYDCSYKPLQVFTYDITARDRKGFQPVQLLQHGFVLGGAFSLRIVWCSLSLSGSPRHSLCGQAQLRAIWTVQEYACWGANYEQRRRNGRQARLDYGRCE